MTRSDGTSWLVRCVIVAAIALGTGACGGGIGRMPEVDVPLADGEAGFERLVAVARAHGYTVAPLQPSRGRFGLRTHYTDRYVDEYGPYRIAIQCYTEQTCSITPLGPRVERVGPGWELPRQMREEIELLQTAMGGVPLSER